LDFDTAHRRSLLDEPADFSLSISVLDHETFALHVSKRTQSLSKSLVGGSETREELLVRNPIRGIFVCCCARALNPRTNANVGAKIDDRTSFCIAHLVFEAITHAVIA